MPRDHHVRRALALQRDPSLPPSLELSEGLCPILRPDGAMKERLERHEPPLPVCPGGGCAVRRFFEGAAEEGAAVELEIVEHFRGPKLISFDKKRRKGYSRTVGHRQELTRATVKSL